MNFQYRRNQSGHSSSTGRERIVLVADNLQLIGKAGERCDLCTFLFLSFFFLFFSKKHVLLLTFLKEDIQKRKVKSMSWASKK